ncbi:MAG TPA: hypothetical protein VMA76_07665 [Solirubrobacteraceae bacterium]|nr:hypothetical protein [Solirubrobacteraceae bacterium]
MRISLVVAVVGAALAGASAASAATIPAPPLPPPGAIGPPTVAVAPIVPQCTTTPALQAAAAMDPAQSAASLCSQYGTALSPSMARLRRQALKPHKLRSHATSLCVGAGCTYVWLWNEGGGWGYVEALAEPFSAYGHVVSGWAYFSRTTNNDPYSTVANWSDAVLENDPPGWDSERYIYPICNASGKCKASWVGVGYSGQVLVSGPPPITAGLGPVITWNYITD